MVDVLHVHDLSGVVAFALTALVVFSVTKAVFYGFWAAEFQFWLVSRVGDTEFEMRRLEWELKNGAHWDADVVRNHPQAAKRPLSTEQISERIARRAYMARATRAVRALRYFLDCPLCQSFWVSVAIVAAFAPDASPAGVVLSAFAYSGLVFLAARRVSPPESNGATAKAGGCGCGKGTR